MSEMYNGQRLLLQMKDNGGGGIKDKIIPTHIWLRECEIQIEANENQKISISREDGLLVVHFWTTGVTDNSGADYKAVVAPLGCHPRIEIEECINGN